MNYSLEDKPPWGLVDESAKPTCKFFSPQGSFGLNGPCICQQRTSTNINEPVFYMLHCFVSFEVVKIFSWTFYTPCLGSTDSEVSIHWGIFLAGCKNHLHPWPTKPRISSVSCKALWGNSGAKDLGKLPRLKAALLNFISWSCPRYRRISYSPWNATANNIEDDMSKKMLTGFMTVTKYG